MKSLRACAFCALLICLGKSDLLADEHHRQTLRGGGGRGNYEELAAFSKVTERDEEVARNSAQDDSGVEFVLNESDVSMPGINLNGSAEDEEGEKAFQQEDPGKNTPNQKVRPIPENQEWFQRRDSPFSNAFEHLNRLHRNGKKKGQIDIDIKKPRKRDLASDLEEFNSRGVWVKRCQWREGKLREPLQDFVTVLRRVNQIGASAGGNFASCFEIILGEDRAKKAFEDLNKISPIPIINTNTDCTSHADCGSTHQPQFCSADKKCVNCKNDEKEDICDETSSDTSVKPIGSSDQCFNVCPLDALSPTLSCTLSVVSLVLLTIYYIAYFACGDAEDTGSYADSVFQGRKYKPQREFDGNGVAAKLKKITAYVFRTIGLATNAVLPIASYILTGVSVYSWTRGIFLFFWTLVKLFLLPFKIIFKIVGLIYKPAKTVSKVLNKIDQFMKKPYEFSKRSSDEVLAKCLVPCDDPNSQILDNMKILNPGLYQEVLNAGLVAKPWSAPFDPGKTTPRLQKQACNKKISNGKAGILRKFQKVTLKFLELYYDFQVFNQLYFYFAATPIENFICGISNVYTDLESAFDSQCQSDPDRPYCSNKNRRRGLQTGGSLDSKYIGNLWKEENVAAAIDRVVADKIKPGVDILVDSLDFVAVKMKVITENVDVVVSAILGSFEAMKALVDVMEKISINLASPMEPITKFLESLSGLLNELNIDVTVLEDLDFKGPFDWLFESVINVLFEAFVPGCDNIEDCLTKLLIIEPFNLDCDCFGSDDCEEKGSDRDCVDLLFSKLGINLDLSFLDGLLDKFDLPDIKLGEFEAINLAFLTKISDLFNIPFFDIDFDPYNALLNATELKDIFNVTLKSYRVLSDGTDNETIKFDCPSGFYPIVRNVEFTKGQRCTQDLSAVFRYPCLDSEQQYIASCEVEFQGLLVQACTDEIVPFFDIEPVIDTSTVLSWLPADNPFREAYNKGVLEALYLCWSESNGEPQFLGELLTKPEQANVLNTPNRRFTETFVQVSDPTATGDNQIFISGSENKFVPDQVYPKCADVTDAGEFDVSGAGVTGTIKEDFDATTFQCRDTIKVDYFFVIDLLNLGYEKTVDFREQSDTECSDDCTSEWFTPSDAWPGSALPFEGSKLDETYSLDGYPDQSGDENYSKSDESIKGCRTGRGSGCTSGVAGVACRLILDPLIEASVSPKCQSIDSSVIRHTQSAQLQLGSTQNLLMRRQYWGPDFGSQNDAVCPSGREIFVEYYEMEPCIEEDTYGQEGDMYKQGYCSFRAAMGDLERSTLDLDRFESMCTGQRACNLKCKNDNDEQGTTPFYGCNCRDNNCVTSNGNYLHKVWRNLDGGDLVDSFDDFVRSLDKGTAYKNWGTCTYWMDGRSEVNQDRVHDSVEDEEGRDTDSLTSRKRYDTLKQCMDEPGNDRDDCERVFEPMSSSCPFGSRTDPGYDAAVTDYDISMATLETNCGTSLEKCEGQGTCNVTSCTPNVGVFQYACMRPEGLGGFGRFSAGFIDSMRANPRQIICPENSIGISGVAIYGRPFEQEDVTEVFFENLCKSDTDGTISCDLDANEIAGLVDDTTTDSVGKTLRVDYTCRCANHFLPYPDATTNECVPCPASQVYFADIDTGCHYCPRGTYYSNENGEVDCIPAPAGSYVEVTSIGAPIFRLCPPFTYNDKIGSTSVEDCRFPPENFVATGTYVESLNATLYDETAPCPAGFDRKRDDTQCLKCPAGYYRLEDSTEGCTPCEAGYESNTNRTGCDPCPPGYYSYEGAETCLPCTIGCYAEAAASTQCERCPVGKTTVDFGQASCDEDSVTVSSNTAYDDNASCEDLIEEFAPWLLQEPSVFVNGKVENLTAEDAVNRNVGNGFCDGFPLNTAPCGYDGGDCCQSTCVSVFEKQYPGGIYDFFLDFKETAYFQALENNITNAVATNISLPLLIGNLTDLAAELLEANENLTDAGDAFVGLAKEIAIALDLEEPEEPGAYGINLTESQKDGFPFDIERDSVFYMADVDGDEEVEVKELVTLFMELYEVASAELDIRSLDRTCQSFRCLDPAVIFKDTTCDGDQLVSTNLAEDPDPDYCDNHVDNNIMNPRWYEEDPAWGDGRCDDRFNHKSCDYDGGDCCIGTCQNNPCIASSCREDSFNCRDPDGLVDTQPPRLSIRQESIVDVVVEPDAVPTPLVVTATDNVYCAPPNVTYTSVRTDGQCETSYRLQRTWGACDASDNCAEEVTQTVAVVDTTAPLEQYRDMTLDGSGDPMPVICIDDRNWKWIVIPNATDRTAVGLYNVENPTEIPNNIEPDPFGLQAQLTSQFQESDLRWQFYDAASVSVSITNCTNSACGDNAGCFYNATDDTLYLQAGVPSSDDSEEENDDNVYTIIADVTDDCGNVAEVSRQVLVPKSSSKSTKLRYGEDLCNTKSSKTNPLPPNSTGRRATLDSKSIASLNSGPIAKLPKSTKYCGAGRKSSKRGRKRHYHH